MPRTQQSPPAMPLPDGYVFGESRTEVLAAGGLAGHVVTQRHDPRVTDGKRESFRAVPLEVYAVDSFRINGRVVRYRKGQFTGGPGWSASCDGYVTAGDAARVLHANAARVGITNPAELRIYLGADGQYRSTSQD